MELKDLRKHIRTLAALPETGAPVISCYLALERGAPKDRNAIDERVRSLRDALIGQARHDFGEAMERIEAHLATELTANARGAAVFSRAGEQPYFLPLQFRVPLPTWVAVDGTPNVYHLVELKDTYHRYVVTQCLSRLRGIRVAGPRHPRGDGADGRTARLYRRSGERKRGVSTPRRSRVPVALPRSGRIPRTIERANLSPCRGSSWGSAECLPVPRRHTRRLRRPNWTACSEISTCLMCGGTRCSGKESPTRRSWLLLSKRKRTCWSWALEAEQGLRMLAGSIAERVAGKMPCSMITVKSEHVIRLRLDAGVADIKAQCIQGQELLKKEFPAEAVCQFEQCIAQDSMYIPAWEGLAAAHTRLGHAKEAER